MKLLLFVIFLATVFMLQACGGQTTKAEPVLPVDTQPLSNQAITDIKTNNQADLNSYQVNPVSDEQLTTTETQIIRELYHAGCLIEDFVLDRRKQNMHISCAKDLTQDDSKI